MAISSINASTAAMATVSSQTGVNGIRKENNWSVEAVSRHVQEEAQLAIKNAAARKEAERVEQRRSEVGSLYGPSGVASADKVAGTKLNTYA